MYHLNIPLIYVFMIFTGFSGLVMFYCWTIIHKAWKRIIQPNLPQNEGLRSRLIIAIMVIPLLGFGFEFIYFLYKTLQELLMLISV
jgi:hypothetical protein